MFTEPQIKSNQFGWVEVICGSMFSGKTEELIRRLKRAEYAGLSVEIFKPTVDNRYSEQAVVSHNKNEIPCTSISKSTEILEKVKGTQVIGIDEAQFFDKEIVQVVNTLANRGARVIVAGLDMDYLAKPFSPMPQLMSEAEYVTKLHAICMRCGNLASRSYRKSTDKNLVLLGEKNQYEALCRSCYNKAIKSD